MNRPSALHSAELELALKSVSRTGTALRLVSTSQMPVRPLLASMSVVRRVYATCLPSGETATSEMRSRRTRSCTVNGGAASFGAARAAAGRFDGAADAAASSARMIIR